MPIQPSNLRLKKNPRWNMLLEDGRLVVTGGGDEIYMVDELGPDDSARLHEAYLRDDFETLADSFPALADTLRRLERSGVLHRACPATGGSTLVFGLSWFGKPNPKIEEFLRHHASALGLGLADEGGKADLRILLRTSGTMAALLKDYEKIQIPHLLADLGFEHTLSLGPLVFPGETACLGCYVGRITRHWGDAAAPEEPGAGEHAELAGALILEQVKTFRDQGTCPALIEKAWAFNLNDWTARTDSVFRLPWCPHCFPDKPLEGTGSFELPWAMRPEQEKAAKKARP